MVRKHQTRNLEIPGSMLTHRPGMTLSEGHFFTSGHRDNSSGWKASLPATVPTSL